MHNVADEEAVLVGRALNVKRVRQLNAKDYFYQMLKDNPDMLNIRPGVEDELMVDAIDHHIHAFPDFVPRGQDMIQVAIDASRAKMRALGFKDHWNITSSAAYLAQRHIDYLVEKGELTHRVEIFGGVGTCFGVRPDIIRIALQYPNCKMIWFPTFTSAGYLRGAGKDPSKGASGGHPAIYLVDDNGNVLPEVVEVLKMAAAKKIGVGWGHTDFKELLPLAKKAKELGVRSVLDHPLLELNKLLMDEMKELASLGVYIGAYCQPMIPSLYQPVVDPMETVRVIKEIGAERCIIGSDFGQVLHMDTIPGIRVFIRALLAFGIKRDDIRIMFKDNPERLLYLRD
jgi:hypothetical protein